MSDSIHRPEILLLGPQGEHELHVTENWRAFIDGHITYLRREEGVALNGLIQHADHLITSLQLWRTMRTALPPKAVDDTTAMSIVNKDIGALRGKLSEVSPHIVRLGRSVTSRILFCSDIRAPEFGLQIIENSDIPGDTKQELSSEYQGRFEPPKQSVRTEESGHRATVDNYLPRSSSSPVSSNVRERFVDAFETELARQRILMVDFRQEILGLDLGQTIDFEHTINTGNEADRTIKEKTLYRLLGEGELHTTYVNGRPVYVRGPKP